MNERVVVEVVALHLETSMAAVRAYNRLTTYEVQHTPGMLSKAFLSFYFRLDMVLG